MKAKMNLENMKLLGILEMVERKLLENACYHELGFNEIKKIFHNIRYDCGRRWFPKADEEAYNVHFKQVGKNNGPGQYVCTVTCENCNYPVEDCEFVSEEELRESYKNFGRV